MLGGCWKVAMQLLEYWGWFKEKVQSAAMWLLENCYVFAMGVAYNA